MGCEVDVPIRLQLFEREALETIAVLSECDPGFELGWVSGTEFATGCWRRR